MVAAEYGGSVATKIFGRLEKEKKGSSFGCSEKNLKDCIADLGSRTLAHLPPHQALTFSLARSNGLELTWTLIRTSQQAFTVDTLKSMLLNLLTAVFLAAVGAALLVCLALGLFSLSQYIEAHAARGRRYGLRALYLVALIQLLLVLIDNVPLLPLLPNLCCAILHYLALSQPNWPFSCSSSPPNSLWTGLASLVLLPLASHIWLVRHHTLTLHAWHQHRYDTLHRPKLAGGRLDWDVNSTEPPAAREMTNLQVCAVLALCVWSVPVYRLLGRIAAAEWGSGGVVVDAVPSK